MSALRATLILISALLWLSFWLSSWNIHWLAYLPAAMLLIAGFVGFCPATWLLGKVGFKPSNLKA